MVRFGQMLQNLSRNTKKVRQIKGTSTPQFEDVSILTTEPIRKLTPGKMIVINLPGNGTSLTDDAGNPKEVETIKRAANEGVKDFFKFVNDTEQNEMSMQNQDCQTVACYYSRKKNGLISEFNATEQLHESFKPFADMFDDLISKNGEKILADKAIENMSKVVLRAHCFGTLVASELERYLHLKLATLRYTDAECAAILSAPTALFSSSPVSMDKQPQFFKIVAYANCADTLIPTVTNFPDYKKMVGYSDEDIASDTKQFRTIKPEGKPNYQLTVCSSLDFPSDNELIDYARDHNKDVNTFLATVHKGHAFSAISNILKPSLFMKALQKSIQQNMSQAFSGVVQHYSLGKVHYAMKQIEKVGNIRNVKQLMDKQRFQQEYTHFEKLATTYGARRA